MEAGLGAGLGDGWGLASAGARPVLGPAEAGWEAGCLGLMPGPGSGLGRLEGWSCREVVRPVARPRPV